MSQGLREAIKRADRAEGANRELRRDLERFEAVALASVPMSRLLRLYADLLLASDPLRGRPLESSTPQHPFDRPLPYLSTQSARSRLRLVDRALYRLSDSVAVFFDEGERGSPVCCPVCGGRVDERGRPPNRRRQARIFLEKNLVEAQPEDTVRSAAQMLDISRSTLLRAADELGVIRFDEGGRRWWRIS